MSPGAKVWVYAFGFYYPGVIVRLGLARDGVTLYHCAYVTCKVSGTAHSQRQRFKVWRKDAIGYAPTPAVVPMEGCSVPPAGARSFINRRRVAC